MPRSPDGPPHTMATRMRIPPPLPGVTDALLPLLLSSVLLMALRAGWEEAGALVLL